MTASPTKKLTLIALFISALALFTLVGVIDRHASYTSPNGYYKLVAYRIPMLYSAIGGGSDASGFIILYNNSGFPVRATGIDMVQNLSPPEWSADRVYMKLIFDWKLK